MIIEAVLVVGAVVLVERAYAAYKNGSLVKEVTTLGSSLKNEVANVESKAKAGVAIVEADTKSLLTAAKAVLAKLKL